MAVETAIHDFIADAIANAAPGNPLYQVELNETIYEAITQDAGISIGDVEAEPSPTPDDQQFDEFNARLVIVCYVRIVGTDKRNRVEARDKARALCLEVAKKFWYSPTCDGAFTDARVLAIRRGYDAIKADRYAVANLDLIVNELGQQIGG